jgi:hypothetical protein
LSLVEILKEEEEKVEEDDDNDEVCCFLKKLELFCLKLYGVVYFELKNDEGENCELLTP